MNPTQVNIDPNNKDPFYRYKRSNVLIKPSRKNEKMTQFVNLNEITHQLCMKMGDTTTRKTIAHDLSNQILRRIKKRLGVNINIDDTGIFINGNILAESIESIINDLVVKYLLCPQCKLPEWDGITCTACGKHVSETQHPPVQVQPPPVAESSITEVDNEPLNTEDPIYNELIALYDERDHAKLNNIEYKHIDKRLTKIWNKLI